MHFSEWKSEWYFFFPSKERKRYPRNTMGYTKHYKGEVQTNQIRTIQKLWECPKFWGTIRKGMKLESNDSSLLAFLITCLLILQDCQPTDKGGMYYEFQRNTRSVKSTILHFQVSKYGIFLGELWVINYIAVMIAFSIQIRAEACNLFH